MLFNCEESLTEEILAHSFANNQLINTAPMKIPAPMKEGTCIYGILLTSVIHLLVSLCF